MKGAGMPARRVAAIVVLFAASGCSSSPGSSGAGVDEDAAAADGAEVAVSDVAPDTESDAAGGEIADATAPTPDATPDAAIDVPDVASPDAAMVNVKQHVLLISIDGFHTIDLENYIKAKPQSTLAQLAASGVRFSNASAPFPSDSYPGVLAWATGGTPRTTGVLYDLSYDRTLSPYNTTCSSVGAVIDYTENIDKNNTLIDGGGGIEPSYLPRDPSASCAPLLPHGYLRVNTVFEVAKAAGMRTAWSDKHLSYEILNGPSAKGVDDLFDPEVNAVGSKFAKVSVYDESKVAAILNQIDGKDHLGKPAPVPAIFGMDFQAVSTEQKKNGYLDANATPTVKLQTAMDYVDGAIGKIVAELKAQNLWDSTLFILGASHGQSPIDPALVKVLPTTLLPGLVNEVAPGLLAHITQDAVGLLWLTDQGQTAAVAQHLLDNKDKAGFDHLVTGPELVQLLGNPLTDPRMPDIVVVVKKGTIYTNSTTKIAEHGGLSDDDRKVALLVVGAGTNPTPVPDAVETRQIGVTILQALGLDAQKLQAVVKEGTLALPGLTLK
jgi:hypothetical protein